MFQLVDVRRVANNLYFPEENGLKPFPKQKPFKQNKNGQHFIWTSVFLFVLSNLKLFLPFCAPHFVVKQEYCNLLIASPCLSFSTVTQLTFNVRTLAFESLNLTDKKIKSNKLYYSHVFSCFIWLRLNVKLGLSKLNCNTKPGDLF